MGVSEVDRAHAAALVRAARARNDASGTRVPESADPWLAQLGTGARLADPAERFPALSGDDEEAALAASDALLDLPLFRGWLPEEPFLRAVAARLDEISVSPLYVDEHQRAEQLRATVARAVDDHLDDRRRALLAGRLFTVAEHLERTGDAAHARATAAAARALRTGRPPAAIPFARALVERAFPLAPASPPATPEQPEAGKLIVPP